MPFFIAGLSLFANPTDQTASFGVLDKSLVNKMVVIGSQKGEATYTSMGKPEENQYNLDSDIILQNNGDIAGHGTIKTTGIINNRIRGIMNSAVSMQKLADGLLADTPEGGTGIISSSNSHDLNHDMVTHIQWKSPFAFNLNQSIYLTIPYGIDYFSPSQLRHFVTYTKRHYPAMLMPAMLTWQYTIHLPKNYQNEAMPLNVRVTNPAGSYKSTYTKNKDTIHVIRQLVIAKNYLEPAEYEYFNQLMFKLVSDARSTVVLTKG